MSSRSRRRSSIVLLTAVVLWIAPAAAQEAARDPHAGHRTGVSAPASDAIAPRVMPVQPVVDDVRLVDQDGRPTTLRQAIDAEVPVLVNFIFTTCTTVCPVMSAGFAQFLDALDPARDRVRLVSISIDPDHDTVDALRRYAERYRAGTSWRLLTGTREASIAAQRSFGAYRGDKMNHVPATFIRRPGQPWQVIEGLSSAESLHRAWRDHSRTSR
jgi:protein SCO1/2